MAWMAFVIRLRSTCCSWTRSPWTSGSSCAWLDLDLYPVLLQFAAFKAKCVPDKFVDVERGSRSGITPEYRANASDDLTRAMAVSDDPFECLLRLVDTWHRAIEKAKTRLGTGNHRRQWLSDLVSNRRRHSVSGHESRLALTTLSEDRVEQLRVDRLNLVQQDGQDERDWIRTR